MPNLRHDCYTPRPERFVSTRKIRRNLFKRRAGNNQIQEAWHEYQQYNMYGVKRKKPDDKMFYNRAKTTNQTKDKPPVKKSRINGWVGKMLQYFKNKITRIKERRKGLMDI